MMAAWTTQSPRVRRRAQRNRLSAGWVLEWEGKGKDADGARRDWNTGIIDEFRANQGKVGGMFKGMPLLLLHHSGARSGTVRVNPLAYRKDGDRFVVFGSKGGAPTNPDWYHNLMAKPDATIEVGTEEILVRA